MKLTAAGAQQWTVPCPWTRAGSRRCRSFQPLHMACHASLPELAIVQQPPDAHNSFQPQLEIMQQILREQQQTIAALQQEVQQLKAQQVTTTPPGGSYKGMTIEDFRALPNKIFLVRHAESQGNVDPKTYSEIPDYEVPLSAKGWDQACAAGAAVKAHMEKDHGSQYKLFFMTSPYCRTRQTFVAMRGAFAEKNVAGVHEEVQLREQDFGNFQNPEKIQKDIAERNRFGRFYYRFPDGESGSDVYNRMSIFEDHLIRDMKAGKFGNHTSIVLVSHGLTLRVFLMRWFNWTVESFLQVYNPPNATPVVVEKVSEEEFIKMSSRLDKRQTLQVKQAYRLAASAFLHLRLSPSATVENIDLIGQEYMP